MRKINDYLSEMEKRKVFHLSSRKKKFNYGILTHVNDLFCEMNEKHEQHFERVQKLLYNSFSK